jgi:hypothetical protein
MGDRILQDLMVFVGVMTFMGITGKLLHTVITGFLSRKSMPAANVKAIEDRLARIEQIVEASALEIERIGEGQRFTTKVLTERTGAPAQLPPASRNSLT